MKKSLLTVAAFVAVLGAGTAQAGTDVGQWTAGLGGLWANTDSDRGLDDGAAINLTGGYAMNEKWDFGLNLFAGNHDRIGAAGESTIRGVTFDFNRVFSRAARISPYIVIGAGIIDQFRPNLQNSIGNGDKEVTVKAGGGTLIDLTTFGSSKLQLRADVAVRNAVGRQITDVVGSLGLQMAFGAGGN